MGPPKANKPTSSTHSSPSRKEERQGSKPSNKATAKDWQHDRPLTCLHETRANKCETHVEFLGTPSKHQKLGQQNWDTNPCRQGQTKQNHCTANPKIPLKHTENGQNPKKKLDRRKMAAGKRLPAGIGRRQEAAASGDGRQANTGGKGRRRAGPWRATGMVHAIL
jgi:hypothetical protein